MTERSGDDPRPPEVVTRQACAVGPRRNAVRESGRRSFPETGLLTPTLSSADGGEGDRSPGSSADGGEGDRSLGSSADGGEGDRSPGSSADGGEGDRSLGSSADGRQGNRS